MLTNVGNLSANLVKGRMVSSCRFFHLKTLLVRLIDVFHSALPLQFSPRHYFWRERGHQVSYPRLRQEGTSEESIKGDRTSSTLQ